VVARIRPARPGSGTQADRSRSRSADLDLVVVVRVAQIGSEIDPAGARARALVAAAAVTIVAALFSTAGAGRELVGAQSLLQASLVREAGIERFEGLTPGADGGSIFAGRVARDGEKIAPVLLDARALVGTFTATAAFDDALALPIDALGKVADPLALQAAIGAATAGITDLRLTA
jgi:hypothetical protein